MSQRVSRGGYSNRDGGRGSLPKDPLAAPCKLPRCAGRPNGIEVSSGTLGPAPRSFRASRERPPLELPLSRAFRGNAIEPLTCRVTSQGGTKTRVKDVIGDHQATRLHLTRQRSIPAVNSTGLTADGMGAVCVSKVLLDPLAISRSPRFETDSSDVSQVRHAMIDAT